MTRGRVFEHAAPSAYNHEPIPKDLARAAPSA